MRLADVSDKSTPVVVTQHQRLLSQGKKHRVTAPCICHTIDQIPAFEFFNIEAISIESRRGAVDVSPELV